MAEGTEITLDMGGSPQPAAPTPGGPPAPQNAPGSHEVPSRPEWLDQKFQSTEELQRAYHELERRFRGGPEGESEPQPAPAPAAPTGPQPLGIHTPPEPQPGEGDLDLGKFTREYLSTGALSDASRAEMKARGVPEPMIDSYVEGMEAKRQRAEAQMLEVAGGAEGWQRVSAWARGNLTPAQQKAFNNAVSTGDPDTVELAVRGLVNRYQSSPAGAEFADGIAHTGPAVEPFASEAEARRAMDDVRYDIDEAYRAQVMARMRGMKSNTFVTATGF